MMTCEYLLQSLEVVPERLVTKSLWLLYRRNFINPLTHYTQHVHQPACCLQHMSYNTFVDIIKIMLVC